MGEQQECLCEKLAVLGVLSNYLVDEGVEMVLKAIYHHGRITQKMAILFSDFLF